MLAVCVYNVGMKKKPKKDSRSDVKNMLRIRLTKKERKLLDNFASAKGAGTSTWARMELLAIIRQSEQSQ